MGKLDEYLEWTNERLRRDSIVSAFSGTIFLFLSVYHLITESISFTVVFTFVCACALFFWAIWHFLVYQRSKSVNKKQKELPRDLNNEEVAPGNVLGLTQPSSITELTTQRLDTSQTKKDSPQK